MRYALSLLAAVILFSTCSTNNVTTDNSLQQFFDSAGVKGDFALFDNGQGRFTIYDLPRYRDSLYPAAETFDILQALVAFQTGVLNTPGPYARAFQDRSPVGDVAFQHLADSIGIDTLKKWVDSLQYGNKDIRADSGKVLVRGIKINADQQLGLVKKLYFSQLPFYGRPQQLVRDMMTTEANSNYRLVYKTGRAADLPGPAIGWVIGWVEENKHPYFFVLNVESPDGRARIQDIGIQVSRRILAHLGFFQGKK